jgi:dCTP deaminase
MVINGKDLIEISPIKNMVPHKIRYQGVSHGLGEAGYDIRLKQEVQFGHHPKMGLDYVIQDNIIYSHSFCLASAIEEFDMPNNMVGVVHDKSTWARQGLSVLNTVIEPGWKGFLTLELVCHRRTSLILPAGAGIAQVIFHETSAYAAYEGKYQNQEDEPVPARG